jgi:hypothetical protein
LYGSVIAQINGREMETESEDTGTMFLRNIGMNPEEQKLNNHINENLKTETVTLLRITGVLDCVHWPVFKKLETQRFGNWICFRSQVRGKTPTLLGPLERVSSSD